MGPSEYGFFDIYLKERSQNNVILNNEVWNLKKLQVEHPDWHNGPVGAVGDVDAHLLIVGLAPGRLGANRTGIPFVGDESSRWLIERLVAAGCMTHDGKPQGIRITNAVKCLPPGNRPTGPEIRTCSERWLIKELDAPEVRSVLADVISLR